MPSSNGSDSSIMRTGEKNHLRFYLEPLKLEPIILKAQKVLQKNPYITEFYGELLNVYQRTFFLFDRVCVKW